MGDAVNPRTRSTDGIAAAGLSFKPMRGKRSAWKSDGGIVLERATGDVTLWRCSVGGVASDWLTMPSKAVQSLRMQLDRVARLAFGEAFFAAAALEQLMPNVDERDREVRSLSGSSVVLDCLLKWPNARAVVWKGKP